MMGHRRMATLIGAALVAVALLASTTGPAAANGGASATGGTAAGDAATLALEGDVYNNLVTFTVHIAVFRGQGATTCPIWNQYGTWEVSPTVWGCDRYWLPYGRSDDDIRGSNFDTDGFMVEQDYAVNMGGGTFRHIAGGTWTRIRDNAAANCTYRSDLGKPMCHVYVK